MIGPVDVSVVIPTRDRPRLLLEAVESVLAQTRPAREIIVVDNGTGGGPAEVLERFGAAVRLIRQEPMGVQVARNSGVEAAQATWVALLDDDDRWRPDYLALAEQAIGDGRASVIGGDHRKFTPAGPQSETNFEGAPRNYWDGITGAGTGAGWSFVGRFPLNRLLKYIPFYPSALIIRKNLYTAIGGYDPGTRAIATEDIDFLVRVLAAGELAILWRPVLDYRLHGGNFSHGAARQKIGRWQVFEYLHDADRHGSAEFRAALEKNLRRRRASAFDLAFQIGDFANAKAAAKLMSGDQWSARRRLFKIILTLPDPVAVPAARLLTRLRGSSFVNPDTGGKHVP